MFGADSPADPDAAPGHQRERQVARLGAIDRDEEVRGIAAEIAAPVARGPGDDDRGRVLRQLGGEPPRLLAAARFSKESIDLMQARPGQHTLRTHAIVLAE